MPWDEVMRNIRLQASAVGRSVVEVVQEHRRSCVVISTARHIPEEIREDAAGLIPQFDHVLTVAGDAS